MKNTVLVEFIGQSGKLMQEINASTNGIHKFGTAVKKEFASLRRGAMSLRGQLAAVGLSFGAVQFVKQSGLLDKELTQIGQTAGASKRQVAELRAELFGMAKDGGGQVEGLKDGFNNLVQAGQSWKAALESTRAINIASGVTGAGGGVLAGGLTVGAAAYNIDLETPGKALELLDKMTVAGRLGNAELENLASIFARVGVNASAAGMSFDKTLGFLEALSMVERNPERLATMADSTLRLFTNLRYMAEAQRATKVKFFDAEGERRDAVDVLKDIKEQYDKLKTDQQRAVYVQKAFGHADLDTIKGMRALLQGTSLDKIGEFSSIIKDASGTLRKDFDLATMNLIDQASRLKNTLREAVDQFAKPMKESLAGLIKKTLNPKSDGGLEMSGKQLLGAGAAAIIGTGLIARFGGKLAGGLAKKFLSKGGSLTAGIAEGKVIEAATGVQPVFVTNWPGGTDGGITDGAANAVGAAGGSLFKKMLAKGGGILGAGRDLIAGVLAAGGYGAMATSSALVAGAGAAGYGAGTLINKAIDNTAFADKLGEVLNRIAAFLGNDESKRAIEINMQIDREDRVITQASDMQTSVNAKTNRGAF